MFYLLLIWTVASLHCATAELPRGPVISEFLAQNQSSKRDEDGDSSDWIEIWNSGPVATNLSSWALTDNPANPTKWRFPETPLLPGQRLIVFASDKNRRRSGLELHTNFKLDAGGEYLALTTPEGLVVSEWAPYPVQTADVAYGLTDLRTWRVFLAKGAAARLRVPITSAGTDWTTLDYRDSNWELAAIPVGFDAGQTFRNYSELVLAEDPLFYWNFDEEEGPALNWANPTLIQDALVAQGRAGRESHSFPALGNAATFDGANGSRFVAAHLAASKDVTGAFAVEFWGRTAAPSVPTYFLEGGMVNGTVNSPGLITGFDGARLELFGAGGRTGQGGPMLQDTNWHHVLFGYFGSGAGDGVASRQDIWVDGKRAVSRVNDFETPLVFGGGALAVGATLCCDGVHSLNGAMDELAVYSLSALPDETAVASRIAELSSNHWAAVAMTNFGMPFATDVSSAMHGKATSLQLRQVFVVTNRADFNQMALRVSYDDGFAAWLNGALVLAVNVPPDLLPTSIALTNRSAALASIPVTFDMSEHLHLLLEGTNVLAIQGFNAGLEDLDFLLGAELELGTVRWTSGYLDQPTPGEANASLLERPGPAIRDVTENPPQPEPWTGLLVTARIAPTLQTVSHAQLVYRVMHGVNQEVRMRDDGSYPDVSPGDGVFSASIPAGSFGPGDMIRWSVQAWDVGGASSQAPATVPGSETSHYYGTVACGGRADSGAPVLEWFLPPGMEQAARTRDGARACVFFDGEFYDNVLIQLRGATAAGLDKNPYDFRFNDDHEFRYARGYPRVKRFALNTTWRDKAYVRPVLSFDLFRDAGVPASVAFPLEVRRNKEFFSLALFVELPGKEYLERNGLDPDGALYKADLNGFTMSPQGGYLPAADGFEKKEPDDKDLTDILEFIRGLELRAEELQRFVFDHVDLPGQINYMAASVVVQDADRLVTNFYPYRDSRNTGEWRMLPWDMDLTLGQVNNSIDEIQSTKDSPEGASHPFYGARSTADYRNPALWNRLIDVIINTPVFREMYLRRLRTLMDHFLKPGGVPDSELYFEPRIRFWGERLHQLAEQDRAKWSQWGQSQTLSQALGLIESLYLPGRRTHLFTNHSVLRPEFRQNAGIPLAQSAWPKFQFGLVRTQPAERAEEESFEIINLSDEAWDISGWCILGPIEFTFRPGTVVPAGGTLSVARDVRIFRESAAAQGRTGRFVQGNFTGSLSGYGEKLELRDRSNRVMAATNVSSTASLAQRCLRITELMYHSRVSETIVAPDNLEFIELLNAGESVVDLQGVRLVHGVSFSFDSSAITRLDPGQRLLIVKDADSIAARYGDLPIAGEYSGNLANEGERLTLVDAGGEVIQDFIYNDDWYPLTDGLGFAMIVADETGPGSILSRRVGWRTGSIPGGSPGQPDPESPGEGVPGPLIISEVMFHPQAQENLRRQSPIGRTADLLRSCAFEERDFEYVMLRNLATNTVPLGDAATGRWKLHGAVDFSFSTGVVLEPGAVVLVVGFDPVLDQVALKAFHSAYPWSSGLLVRGPWTGQLDNEGERLELVRQGEDSSGAAVLADVLDYQPRLPSIEDADGCGLSVWRTDVTISGHNRAAWVAAAAGAGAHRGELVTPRIITHPRDLLVNSPASTRFFVGASGWPAVRYQWRFNGVALPDATNSTLTIGATTPYDEGEYSALVYNEAGSVRARPAKLSVHSDVDADGLPDSWMVEHFGRPLGLASDRTRAIDDFDLDGMSNLDEFIAGTLPTDPSSKFELQVTLESADIARLTFSAISNRNYTIQFSDGPLTNAWARLVDIPSRENTGPVSVSAPITTTSRLYRVVTPRIP